MNFEHPFPDWLRHRASTNPDHLAVICGDARLTFQELDQAVDDAAAALATLGVRRGSHVALWLPNGIEFPVILHAISRLGSVPIPINRRLRVAEVTWQLRDCEAQLLVVDDATDQFIASTRQELLDLEIIPAPDVLTPGSSKPSELPRELFEERHPPNQVHSIMYTSGTTGRPKGALLTWNNHWWSAIGSSLNLGSRPDDRWLAVLPFFHVGGLSILIRSLIYGITVVIQPSFEPGSVNRSIEADRVTMVSVVSTMLRRMLDAQTDDRYPDWLRCVLLGGGPAPKPLLDECAERGISVSQTYGLTETASQVATLSPDDALRKIGSAGKPLYPNEIRIGTGAETAPPGDPGEILVRGPIVTAGYYRRQDATSAAIVDGWFHTGDVGYLDDEGYLFVLDRRDDLVVTGGENVYPAEVESVLAGHPDVIEACVLGVPDPEWGQRVVAVIRTREPVSAEPYSITEYCSGLLAKYKIPTSFVFQTDPLPRNAGGKLLRRVVREAFPH